MKPSKSTRKFVICIRNEDCDDLEPRKLYRVLRDGAAAADGDVRVIDESAKAIFIRRTISSLELPKAAEKALLSAA